MHRLLNLTFRQGKEVIRENLIPILREKAKLTAHQVQQRIPVEHRKAILIPTVKIQAKQQALHTATAKIQAAAVTVKLHQKAALKVKLKEKVLPILIRKEQILLHQKQ